MQHETLTSQLERLQKKEISAVELTKSYLEAIDRHTQLGAFISVHEEEALAAAAQCDKAGPPDETAPLRGIPLAIKDALVLNFGKTTCASKILENYSSPFTATSIQKLFQAGAFSIGKTNLDEFAMGSSTENSAFGITRNPWNRERIPGGSSGGSAVAVAAGLAPAAIGTDTGGSIRQPASMCGVTGIKPTYGRVSRYGLIAYGSSLDQVGPMGVSAKDCALLTRIMAGYDLKDATSMKKSVSKWEVPLKQICQGLRIGVPKEYFIDGIADEVADRVENAIRELEKLGAKRVEITLPHTDYAIAAYYVIAPAEASSNLARFDGVRYGHRARGVQDLNDLYVRSRSEGFGKEVQRRILMGTYVLSSGYYEAYYRKAQKVRSLIKSDFVKAFTESCDVIACPNAPSTAFRIGEKCNDPLTMYLEDAFTLPANLAGLPAMSLPCGFDSQGLPVGLQLIGQAWDEHRLLSIGQEYQTATDWHLRKPNMDR